MLYVKEKIVSAVEAKEFVAVCDGVTSEILPHLKKALYPVNYSPAGPHPAGSFETWVPIEYFDKAMSFFMLNRGDLTVLVHPLSDNEMWDHTAGAMWLGDSYRLDLTALSPTGGEN